MNGWWRWLRLELQTERAVLLIPPTAASFLLLLSASSLRSRYGSLAARMGYATAAQDSMPLHLLQGRGTDLDTLGGMVAQEFGLFALAALPLCGLLVAIHLSRSLEDRGLCEVITAGPVGRGGPVAAGLAACSASALVFGICGWGVLAVLGFPVAGSAIYLLSLVALVIASAAVGMVAGQMASTAHQASVVAVGGFLGLYVVRAVVDVSGTGWAWASPLSWLARVSAFGAQPRWWPIACYLFVAAAAGVLAVVVARHRDLGAGLLTPKRGPAGASARLGGLGALVVRLTWPSAALFAGSGAVVAVVMACFAAGDFGGTDAVITRAVQIDALLGCAIAVRAVGVAAGEETTGRCGRVMAAPISRLRWVATVGLVATGWGAALSISTGLISGVGIAMVLDDAERFGPTLAAAVGYLPAVVLVGGLAGLLAGIRPAWAAGVWVTVGWSTLVALPFSDMLHLSEGWRHLSALEWLDGRPLGQVAWGAGGAMVLIAAVGWVVSERAFARRDLVAG